MAVPLSTANASILILCIVSGWNLIETVLRTVGLHVGRDVEMNVVFYKEGKKQNLEGSSSAWQLDVLARLLSQPQWRRHCAARPINDGRFLTDQDR